MVATRVEAGGPTVNAERDLRAQAVTFGAGGEKITAPKKSALTALCRELEVSLGDPATVEEDLLLRVTCYYAGAPVGRELNDRTLKGPATVYVRETAPAQDGSSP